MSGQPRKHGREVTPRRRVTKTKYQQRWLTDRWATAQTSPERLAIVSELARTVASDDRFGDTDQINALIDETARDLRSKFREILNHRTKGARL